MPGQLARIRCGLADDEQQQLHKLREELHDVGMRACVITRTRAQLPAVPASMKHEGA